MAVSFVKSIKLSVIWQIVWQQPQASFSFPLFFFQPLPSLLLSPNPFHVFDPWRQKKKRRKKGFGNQIHLSWVKKLNEVAAGIKFPSPRNTKPKFTPEE